MTKIDNNIPVFVYGTLMRGNALNRAYLQDATFAKETTTLEYYPMYSVGDSFPAVFLEEPYSDDDSPVHGELYLVDGKTLEAIDKAEGCQRPTGYRRAKVTLEDGSWAWIYFLEGEHTAWKNCEKRVKDGKWVKPTPPLILPPPVPPATDAS